MDHRLGFLLLLVLLVVVVTPSLPLFRCATDLTVAHLLPACPLSC